MFGLAENGLGEQAAQPIELPVRFLELAGKKPDALDEHADMRHGSLGDAWSDNQRLLFQDGKNLGRVDAANAMALEEFFDLCLAQPGRLGWGGRRFPQRENPFFRKIGVEPEHLGIIALELFTQAVGVPDFIGAEVIGHARPFAQLDDGGAGERDLMERAAIGSKRRGQRLCVL